MEKMKIYIAGKVTGLPKDEVTAKFESAASRVRELGHIPVNPIEVVNDWHCTWNEAMGKCIAALVKCDAVYKLPCSSDSRGAKIELTLAEALDMLIINGK